jgi:peptidyl-prolyl cis-trans isomerase C
MPSSARHLCAVAVIGLIAAYLAAVDVRAQGSPIPPGDDPVLVENSTVTIRRSDYQRELERLPPDVRPGFSNSEKRVNDLLRRMLIERTLAAQARAEKLESRPEHAARFAMEQERLYAQLKVAEIDAVAAAGFDAKRAQWEARAREIYQIDRAKYSTPEQVSASHILFDTKARTSDEARKLAAEALAKANAGADFNVLAREVSEDRSAKSNSGQLGWFTFGEMDPAFAKAAFALAKTGELSEPVQSSFGWHVIRLDGRRPAVQKPFEEVRESILAELKQKYVNDEREAAVAKLRTDPTIRANREAIDALVTRVEQDAVRRAVQQQAPGATAPPSK